MVVQPNNTPAINIKNRLAPLDGLRAFAALGVLWIHLWTHFGNPRLIVKGVDIASILALGGNGVDLFFVISGFCMYYFYANNRTFAYPDLWKFIKKRWVRLSPACYTAALVYIIINVFNNPTFPFIKSALTAVTYSAAVLPVYSPNGILWSLTPEWQFYIIVPFLLIYQGQLGFKKIFLIITCFLLAMAVSGVLIFKGRSDILTDQIIFRYFEFMWGILVGRILLIYPNIQLKYRYIYFLFFVLITYSGRVMIAKPVLALAPDHYNLFKLIGFTLMGLGFAGIMYLTLTSKKWLKQFFGNSVLSFIGKISFSFYLWHTLVLGQVGKVVMTTFPAINNMPGVVVSFFISVMILIPLSALSFNLLERPFTGHKSTK